MDIDREGERRPLDADTARMIGRQMADAEQGANGVRIAVLGGLAMAAALYAPHVPRSLTLVHALVLAPMLAWAVGQHFLVHRTRRAPEQLFLANIVLDITATTCLLLGYGIWADPNMAAKSPVFSMYFVVLATRPFTGSPRRAAFAGGSRPPSMLRSRRSCSSAGGSPCCTTRSCRRRRTGAACWTRGRGS